MLMTTSHDGEVFYASRTVEQYLGFHQVRAGMGDGSYNVEQQKKTSFFNANSIAFTLGKTKKLNVQMKALEKIFKSRPIPLF